jgi:cyclohexanecarboxyl-CoA dehydrogenase
MLDFSFTEEQDMMRKMVQDFARKEIAPGYKERVKTRTIPRELIKKMAALGILGMNVPEKYGGQPQPAVTVGLVMEELAKSAADAALLMFFTCGQAGLIMFGPEETRQEWLPPMVRGEKMVVVCATEAEAGSDLGGLQAMARRDGDYYILNGKKNRTSFAYMGNAAIVLARTNPASKMISTFLVPLDSPGVTMTPIYDMGTESTVPGIVTFEDVRIPKKYLLGDEEGKGFTQMMRSFDYNRALLALITVGAAEVSLEETCAYTRQRVQFGKPLANFQAVSFKLAEAATYLEMTKWLCYRTLWMKDKGIRHSKESGMVKWFGPKIACDIIHDCLLTHGHYGYTKDLPFEQRLRDTMSVELGDGTAEIMKLIIARDIIGREFVP